MLTDELLWGLAMLFGLLGVVLLVRGWRWDPPRGRRRCPKCWYEISGGVGRCSECGFEAKRPRQWRKTRRRKRLIATSLGVILAATGLARLGPQVRDNGWRSVAPTTVLIAVDLYTDDAASTAMLLQRAERDSLTSWQWRWLLSGRAGRIPVKSTATDWSEFSKLALMTPYRVRTEAHLSRRLIQALIAVEDDRELQWSAFEAIHRLQRLLDDSEIRASEDFLIQTLRASEPGSATEWWVFRLLREQPCTSPQVMEAMLDRFLDQTFDGIPAAFRWRRPTPEESKRVLDAKGSNWQWSSVAPLFVPPADLIPTMPSPTSDEEELYLAVKVLDRYNWQTPAPFDLRPPEWKAWAEDNKAAYVELVRGLLMQEDPPALVCKHLIVSLGEAAAPLAPAIFEHRARWKSTSWVEIVRALGPAAYAATPELWEFHASDDFFLTSPLEAIASVAIEQPDEMRRVLATCKADPMGAATIDALALLSHDPRWDAQLRDIIAAMTDASDDWRFAGRLSDLGKIVRRPSQVDDATRRRLRQLWSATMTGDSPHWSDYDLALPVARLIHILDGDVKPLAAAIRRPSLGVTHGLADHLTILRSTPRAIDNLTSLLPGLRELRRNSDIADRWRADRLIEYIEHHHASNTATTHD